MAGWASRGSRPSRRHAEHRRGAVEVASGGNGLRAPGSAEIGAADVVSRSLADLARDTFDMLLETESDT